MSIIAAYAVPHPPLLIPGVGDESKLQVQKTQHAYEQVARRSAEHKPETLVVFSPHAAMYVDYLHISPGSNATGNFGDFGVPEARYAVEYDEEFVASLENLLAQRDIPGGTMGERDRSLDHGTMVPLHFFGKAAGDEGGTGKGVRVVRIGLSGLSRKQHWEFGKAVASIAEKLGRRTVIIASGDLSHKLLASGPYGYTPKGPEFDRQLCACFADDNLAGLMDIDEELSEAAAECGLRSFLMMAGALEDSPYVSELLSYEGPFGVGYAVADFTVSAQAQDGSGTSKGSLSSQASNNNGNACTIEASEQRTPHASSAQSDELELTLEESEESLPVALARKTLQTFFGLGNKRPSLSTPDLEALLKGFRDNPDTQLLYEELTHKRAGAFVSLHEHDELRGCIGTIAPTTESVLAEIVQNAVSAAREDPRFPPVGQDELPLLNIKVDILGEAEPVADRSTLDAQRYGVIVSLGYRRGLLLPALEGVETPEEQIAIALSKAGIGAHEPYELERFEVVRYT